ncbi:hypothetical protein ACFLKC_14330 [Clostridium caseinilyticum]|uniref:hypothetical protein n=1 Tax=Clostridium caseinilyticum TaxID=3350403 RepID=UPI0038F64279
MSYSIIFRNDIIKIIIIVVVKQPDFLFVLTLVSESEVPLLVPKEEPEAVLV